MRGIGWLLTLLALGAWLYYWQGEEIAGFVKTDLSEDGNPGLFLLMFVLLPPLGFPISAFLVLLGIKFGGLAGVLIMTAGMPIHLLAAFLLANSFLRPWVRRVQDKTAHRLPRMRPGRSLGFSLLFMAVPGLPYSIKNVLLALSGVPFRHFFLSGLLVQGAMGVPLVLAGEALAGKNALLLAVALLVLLGAYAVLYRLRKGHGISVAEKDDGQPVGEARTAQRERKEKK